MRVWCLLVSLIGLCGGSWGILSLAAEPYQPAIAPASKEGEAALTRIRHSDDLTAELVAAEPLLANPVAFCFDEQGRIYVAETFRQQNGVEDNRSHMDWLDDDLAANTVADRLAFFRKHLRDKVASYAKEHDRIRLLEDRDHDGKYETSTVFRDGFSAIEEGTGAGVLAWRGQVYYTCIPHLWMLKDADGDGQAEVKKSLSEGYGVRVAFRGHDSHGLRMGPDGRVYFSIGDRGFNIPNGKAGKPLVGPDAGAVFRCEPDGSQLEVFAFGLRNPQELAFDEFGNLFTGDNNSDSGDRARWVHVVEGAEVGWRMYYQYLPDRGPWNREKLWHPAHPEQPAYIVPPIINFADGPSGLTYYPGVGLPERYQGHFFLADFRGGPANSGVRSFALKPKGASFEMDDAHEFLWSILATDVEFGYDGNFYLTDWVDGWNGLGKGRIYRFTSKSAKPAEAGLSIAEMFAKGFSQRPVTELLKLLTHPDQRVRQETQFALVDHGEKVAPDLLKVAQATDHRLARLHAIWGLGQLGRKQPKQVESLIPLLEDTDEEVRSQVAKVLGEAPLTGAVPQLIPQLKHPNLRVRLFAAQALAKLGSSTATEPLLACLEENADADPTLRHGCTWALGKIATAEQLQAASKQASPAVRMGVVLAYRHQRQPRVAEFLNDTEPRLVDEAARAIHDLPLPEGMPALAGLAGRTVLSESTWRRVINANLILGSPASAEAVAQLAARNDLPEMVRLEALHALDTWSKPSSRDRVLGAWRPITNKRDPESAHAAMVKSLGGIFVGSNAVRTLAAQVAVRLGVKDVGPLLVDLAGNRDQSPDTRIAAIQGLAALKHAQLRSVTETALKDEVPAVRAVALTEFTRIDPKASLPHLEEVLKSGTTVEIQAACGALADMKARQTDDLLLTALERWQAGEFPQAARLDLQEAVRKRNQARLNEALAKVPTAISPEDKLAAYRVCLEGGDAARGRSVFQEKAAVSCVRCHKAAGRGGDVGPDLTKLHLEKPREYLLESIVLPNQQIAKGFESVILALDDGQVVTGVLKQETKETLQLVTAEGKALTIEKARIEERSSGKSPMPEDVTKHLSLHEIRDLVEFLATLP